MLSGGWWGRQAWGRRLWENDGLSFRRLPGFRVLSARKMFIGDLPGVALGISFLADPMEAVGGDLGETPSGFQAARVIAELDDVLPLGPPDLVRVIPVERVVPYDVPAIDPRIEDAQCRAIHR